VKPLPRIIRCATIAGSLDGKTFLQAGLSRGLWNHYGYRSIAFDPYRGETDWGRQAMVIGPTKQMVKAYGDEIVFSEFERFRRIVRGIEPHQKFAVFWDEGTSTGGRDRDNTGLFTAIRHNTNAFFFVGHGYVTMLPIMRGSLSDVILAACDPKEAVQWKEVMVDEDIMQASRKPPSRGGDGLEKYEFLHKQKHERVKILRYSAPEIRAGIIL